MRDNILFVIKSVVTSILIFLVACGGSSTSNTNDNTGEQAKTIQEVLDNSVTQGVNGIFIYVDKTNTNPISLAEGIQNTTNSRPASNNALFKIASISKMFIAVASTMLIGDGTLQETDTLAMWLPDLAPRIANSEQITIKNLLQHRSGVPDFDSQTGFSWNSAHTDIDTTLEFALDLPADFSPDATYQYSNTNYLLIGKILDTALGYSHHTYIQDNILSPLNMNNTYHLFADAEQNLVARGYWNNTDYTEQDYVIPGGSMVSTTEDVAIFIRQLATGNLLDDETQNIYNGLALGYGHSGWLPGYQSIARYHSNIDAVIVQFVNTTGGQSEDTSASSYAEIVRLVSSN